jgi:hypothetical protein
VRRAESGNLPPPECQGRWHGRRKVFRREFFSRQFLWQNPVAHAVGIMPPRVTAIPPANLAPPLPQAFGAARQSALTRLESEAVGPRPATSSETMFLFRSLLLAVSIVSMFYGRESDSVDEGADRRRRKPHVQMRASLNAAPHAS